MSVMQAFEALDVPLALRVARQMRDVGTVLALQPLVRSGPQLMCGTFQAVATSSQERSAVRCVFECYDAENT